MLAYSEFFKSNSFLIFFKFTYNNPYLKLYENSKNIGNLQNKRKLWSGKQIEALEGLPTLKQIYEGIAAVALVGSMLQICDLYLPIHSPLPYTTGPIFTLYELLLNAQHTFSKKFKHFKRKNWNLERIYSKP